MKKNYGQRSSYPAAMCSTAHGSQLGGFPSKHFSAASFYHQPESVILFAGCNLNVVLKTE
jgi:hypothetical protein